MACLPASFSYSSSSLSSLPSWQSNANRSYLAFTEMVERPPSFLPLKDEAFARPNGRVRRESSEPGTDRTEK